MSSDPNTIESMDKNEMTKTASHAGALVTPHIVGSTMDKRTPIIFTDLDGTLLDHHDYTLTAAEATLKRMAEANVQVIPNTSKTFAEVSLFCQQHQFKTPFICENGAAVFIPLNLFPQKPKGTLVYNGYWMKAFTHPRQYWLNLLSQQSGRYQFCYENFNAMSVDRLVELTGLAPEDALRAQRRDFGEPLYWVGTDEEKSAFVDMFTEKGANVVAGGRFLHVGGQACKGDAMKWLVAEFERQFPDQQFASIALGDGNNDIGMLNAADYAVRVKSPVNPFPVLQRGKHIYDSTLTGPAGWSECLENLFTSQFGGISNG